MARVTYTLTDLRSGATRFLVGPDGVLVNLVATLQRRVLNRAKINAPVDTGYMRNSGRADTPRVVNNRVFGGVEFTAKYAKYVHDGTRQYVIQPRNAQALRGGGSGRAVVSRQVTIPARRGRPFLLNAFKVEAPRLGFTVPD